MLTHHRESLKELTLHGESIAGVLIVACVTPCTVGVHGDCSTIQKVISVAKVCLQSEVIPCIMRHTKHTLYALHEMELKRKEESWGVWWYRVAVHSIGMYVYCACVCHTVHGLNALHKRGTWEEGGELGCSVVGWLYTLLACTYTVLVCVTLCMWGCP